MPRNYISDLAGGTVTATIQFTENATIKSAIVSYLSAAAGKIELSLAPASQIGVAQPTKDVLFRLNCSATAGNVVANVPLQQKVKPFDTVYVHQTGAGNLGSITLSTDG